VQLCILVVAIQSRCEKEVFDPSATWERDQVDITEDPCFQLEGDLFLELSMSPKVQQTVKVRHMRPPHA
jgi:hypothetical protein